MKILEQSLNTIKCNKKQRDFLMLLIRGMIGILGKRTFRNLARYMQIAEHTFARQMAKVFDFVGLNIELIKIIKQDGDRLIGAQDSSFITKSGKKTYGLGFVWNGSAGRAEKGLEIDTIAAVKVGSHREGYTISTEQVPADHSDFNKIDFCLTHLKKVASKLFELGIKDIAADAFFAKKKYVDGVVSLGFNVISKLRKDARLRRPYQGPQKARGRKKMFEVGKVRSEDFEQSPVETVFSDEDERIELSHCIAYSESLKRTIKVVRVRNYRGKNKCGEALLFSTDLNLDAPTIYEFYVSRFQIEFVFRDAKQFTGLNDCQSRDPRRLHFHFNASFVALNVAKIQDAQLQKARAVRHSFSMANWTRRYHVDIVINRIISMLGFDQTLIKSHTNYDNLLSFGSITH